MTVFLLSDEGGMTVYTRTHPFTSTPPHTLSTREGSPLIHMHALWYPSVLFLVRNPFYSTSMGLNLLQPAQLPVLAQPVHILISASLLHSTPRVLLD